MTNGFSRRAIFLDEMGLGPVWTLRQRPAPGECATVVEAASPVPVVSAGVDNNAGETMRDAPATRMDASVNAGGPSSAPPTPLEAKGIQDGVGATQGAAPLAQEVADMDWTLLKDSVSGCVKCGLCEGRNRTVFGVGDEKARWLFIGEGPGRNEDMRGEPFVGPAGKLLDNMLSSIGLRRGSNVYIANIVKCRATDEDGRDRRPSAEEIAACLPYLKRQIALIQPTILVALGKTAALSLLGLDPDTPVSQLRGTVHRYEDLPLVVTYHPAYLLRNQLDKKKAWEDLSLAMAAYAKAG